MNIEYTELALIIGVMMALVKLLEKGADYIYKIFTRQSDKDRIDTKQEIGLALIDSRLKVIETNHLPHIQNKMDEIEKTNNLDHELLKVGQAKLETKIDILLKK